MDILAFLPFAMAFFIVAVIPGPGIAAGVAKALGSGFRSAFYYMNGLILGDLTYLTFAILGLSAIASMFGGFFIVVKFAGAAYLLWLAWNFWHAGIDPKQMRAQKGKGFWSCFLSGYAVTMGNPKPIIFYMALLPSVIDIEAVTINDYLVLVVLVILILYAVITPYILLASKARTFLSSPVHLRILNRSAAGMMAGAAAFIMFKK